MDAKTLFAALALAAVGAAADTTVVQPKHGPNFDPVRHERMMSAMERGDTATVRQLREEARAARMARREAMRANGAGAGQGMGGRGQGMGAGNGQCPRNAAGAP